jgi:HlyD family secretion protein
MNPSHSLISKFASFGAYTRRHVYMSVLVVLIVLGGSWFTYQKVFAAVAPTHYILGTVQKETIIASVSASGQVSASNQVDISSKVSGDIISVPVSAGQKIGAGALIAQIDPGDSAYELETEKLSYQKLTTVDPDTLTSDQTDVQNAYDDARVTLATVSSNLIDQLQNLENLYGGSGYLTSINYTRSTQERAMRESAEASYEKALEAVKKFNVTTRTISLQSSHADIQAAIAAGYEAALESVQATKDAKDTVYFFRSHEDNPSVADSATASVSATLSSINTSLSSIISSRDATKKADDALKDLLDGPDQLDARAAELSVRQKQEALDDYSIRAPFSGTLATLDVSRGDAVSSNTKVATMISTQKIAELSLNEVDAAKIKVGDKATLTFDAIDGLTLTGKVASIDAIGTVTQGVVSYTVKIAFDSQDDRVKPGMTVNASIITDAHQDVLAVPSSAVKSQNGASYVLAFDPPRPPDVGGTQGVTASTEPKQIPVTIGITDDTNVEILSGLSEGQQIVTRTVTSAQASAATTARSGTATRGGGLGGPGVVRF